MSIFFKKIFNKIYYLVIGWRIQRRDEIIDGKRVWFISDMHFGHANIIRWCRGDVFKNLKDMHKRLIANWNYSVGKYDRVYCLGDFGNFKFKKYLKGRITILKGNHDKKQWNKQFVLKYKDLRFLIIHDPNDATKWFDGEWIIHGHTHINSPFIDIQRKHVNVSVEVINYKPINMEHLYKIIKESEKYKDNRMFL